VGFVGSVPGRLASGQHRMAPIVGIAVTHSGKDYVEVGADGGLFNYATSTTRRPVLGLHLRRHPGPHTQEADRRDPAPGVGDTERLNDARPPLGLGSLIDPSPGSGPRYGSSRSGGAGCPHSTTRG